LGAGLVKKRFSKGVNDQGESQKVGGLREKKNL